MKTRLMMAMLAVAGAMFGLAQPEKPASKPESLSVPVAEPVLAFTMKTIDGKNQDLSAYLGKVVIIVNVASKCGYTSQYEHLEKLYKSRKDQGLVILGFPANNFNGQEPGTNQEIARFCEDKFGVTFPMFEKISVKGEDVHPLYKRLASLPEPLGGAPKWNFTKFVLDRKGNAVARFDAKKRGGLEDGLTDKVDELLKAK